MRSTAFGEIEKGSEGAIRTDEVPLGTNVSSVFAGGDVVSGPADVITAIAPGKEAALCIDRAVCGLDLTEGRPAPTIRAKEVSTGSIIKRTRPAMPVPEPRERVGSFAEVMLGLDEKAAIEEARY